MMAKQRKMQEECMFSIRGTLAQIKEDYRRKEEELRVAKERVQLYSKEKVRE